MEILLIISLFQKNTLKILSFTIKRSYSRTCFPTKMVSQLSSIQPTHEKTTKFYCLHDRNEEQKILYRQISTKKHINKILKGKQKLFLFFTLYFWRNNVSLIFIYKLQSLRQISYYFFQFYFGKISWKTCFQDMNF